VWIDTTAVVVPIRHPANSDLRGDTVQVASFQIAPFCWGRVTPSLRVRHVQRIRRALALL
jgi:hypothetical protein